MNICKNFKKKTRKHRSIPFAPVDPSQASFQCACLILCPSWHSRNAQISSWRQKKETSYTGACPFRRFPGRHRLFTKAKCAREGNRTKIKTRRFKGQGQSRSRDVTESMEKKSKTPRGRFSKEMVVRCATNKQVVG